MELKLKLQSPKDLLLLSNCLDTMQFAVLNKSIEMCYKQNKNKMFDVWNKETIDEWFRIQNIKKQIEVEIELLKK